MRITEVETTGVTIPDFETVCHAMWQPSDNMFTPAQYRAIGINVKDAIERTKTDPMVIEAYNSILATLTKLAKRKNAATDYPFYFYPPLVALDLKDKLPRTHWITKADAAVKKKFYPKGFDS